jgi:hypothetical protein
MRSIQTEKWNAEEENMKQSKQNRKNYKTTNNRKTGIKKNNKQENNIQYYFMFYRPGHDHFLKILLCLDYAGLKEPQTLDSVTEQGWAVRFPVQTEVSILIPLPRPKPSATRTAPLSLGM